MKELKIEKKLLGMELRNFSWSVFPDEPIPVPSLFRGKGTLQLKSEWSYKVSLPKVREGTRVGQERLVIVLTTENTCVRSEGCCTVYKLRSCTISSVRRRTPPSKEDFFLNEYMFLVPTLPELNMMTTHKFGHL
jgi:hypothetical protein